MNHLKISIFAVALAGPLSGCGESGHAETTAIDSTPSNVTQGGPQDIGEFRRLLASGEVPSSETLDEVGFFAEHAIDLPPPDCDASVCTHPMLAVAPTFDGGNWTMGFIGMNTALRASDLPALPRHFILVIEDSVETPIPQNLPDLIAAHMTEQDRLSLLSFEHEGVEEVVGASKSDLGELKSLFLDRIVNDTTGWNGAYLDAYSALDHALSVTRRDAFETMAQKVLYFTSGLPEAGATSEETIQTLGRAFSESEIAVSVFGVGPSFRRNLPRLLAESSNGNYFVAASESDFIDAVESEAASGFWPIARDLEIRVRAEPGYSIGAVYGARTVETSDREALLESPTLFIGARQGSSDTQNGRRGGGGGWFVELIADSAPGMMPTTDAPVLSVEVRYFDTISEETVEQSFALSTYLGVGNNPSPEEPLFDPPSSAKPFMMLNMYMALAGALAYYEQGACPLAIGMHDMMELSYILWQRHHDDPDIADDFSLLVQLTQAFENNCPTSAAIWPVEVQTSCFYM